MFRRSTFCIVTGASRGLGKSISIEIGCKLGACSLIVLLARNESDLSVTKKEIENESNVKVAIRVVDFEISEGSQAFMDNFIPDILSESSVKITDFEQVILVHNAGTIGDISKSVKDYSSLQYVRKYFDVNVTSVLGLNSSFWKTFRQDAAVEYRYCVNISSLCAVKPLKFTGLYCAGKAARDMVFQVMAQEDEDVRVLNYSPGPLNTDMSKYMRQALGSPIDRQTFIDLHKNGQEVDSSDSARTLVRVLEDDEFKSGDHVDYYDCKSG